MSNRELQMYKEPCVTDPKNCNITSDFINTTWTNPPESSDDSCPPIFNIFNMFSKYYIPFIILVGLLGNSLSCIVFLTTHLKMRSSSYYLAALAIADFSFLSILLLVHLSAETGFDYYNKPGWCQCCVYFSAVLSTLSVWLIVAFTVERFIAIQYPLQRPHMCTVSRAKAIVLVLTVIAVVSHTYSFVTAGMVRLSNGSEVCELLDDYYDVMRIINMIDTLVTLIGPLILIVVMNTMIARNLFLFRRRFQHGSLDECLYTMETRSEVNGNHTQTGSSNRRNGSHQSSQQSKHSGVTLPISTRKLKTGSAEQLPRCIHVKSSGRNLISTKNQQNITKMLLLISSVFILLNLPSYVLRLYAFLFFSLWRRRPPIVIWCTQQFFMVLYYTNFSINFLLYAVCGVTFRRCLTQLIRNKLARLVAMKRTCGLPQRSASDGVRLQALRE